ncbi:glycosyltransferase family 4 protein [Candidatus Sumerlaeota bacterium]|nr:glycosyltransferase family 4 protein [Candidatus Sumerlaeota bacterium]
MSDGQALQRRKILIITYEFPPVGGGTGKFALSTAQALQRIGFEVAVLTSKFKNQPREDDVDGIRTLRIPVFRRFLNYANALEVLSFGVSGMLSTRWILERFRPELIVCCHSIPSGLIALHTLKRHRIPFLTLLRGQDVPGYPEPSRWMHTLAWPVNRYIWRKTHLLIANSRGLADLAHESAPGLPIEVVNNGVDMEIYRPPREPRTAGTRPVRVVYVGRLVRYKRLPKLIEAWAKVEKASPGSAELAIAGFGPEQPKMEELAAKLDLTHGVKFLGRLDQSKVIETLQAADIFISLAEMEGLPNSVLEAMSCALPTVLSDIGPHRELIEDPKAGLFCDGGDAASVADALLDLIRQPEHRAGFGRAARAIIEKRFAWDHVTRQLASHFPGRDSPDPEAA